MNRWLLSATLCALLSLPAFAQSGATTPHREPITIGGKQLLTLRGTDSAAVQSRASSVYNRLSALGPNIRPTDVRTGWKAGAPVVVVKDRVLVTVTPEDAALNHSTMDVLAQTWRNRVATAYRQIATPDTRRTIQKRATRKSTRSRTIRRHHISR